MIGRSAGLQACLPVVSAFRRTGHCKYHFARMIQIPSHAIGVRMITALILVTTVSATLEAGHTLSARQRQILQRWLSGQPNLRAMTVQECKCPEQIAEMKRGSGGRWTPVPDYHPYMPLVTLTVTVIRTLPLSLLIGPRSQADSDS